MNEGITSLNTLDAAAATQSFIAYGVVLICVVLCGLGGLRAKFFRAIASFASSVIAVLVAFLACDSLAGMLSLVGVPASWSLVAGYAIAFTAALAVVQLLFAALVRAEVMSYPTLVDRLGGMLVGALTGLFLASVVRVGLAMTPIESAVRPTPEQIQADATPRVLQMMSWIFSGDAPTRRAWLYGASAKPYDTDAAGGNVVWGEPFIDENENDLFDRDETFLDKDGNGRYTARLQMGPKKPDTDAAVGAMERYWLGNWRLVKIDILAADAKPPAEDQTAE